MGAPRRPRERPTECHQPVSALLKATEGKESVIGIGTDLLNDVALLVAEEAEGFKDGGVGEDFRHFTAPITRQVPEMDTDVNCRTASCQQLLMAPRRLSDNFVGRPVAAETEGVEGLKVAENSLLQNLSHHAVERVVADAFRHHQHLPVASGGVHHQPSRPHRNRHRLFHLHMLTRFQSGDGNFMNEKRI